MRSLTIGGATLDIFYTAQDNQIQRLSGNHEHHLVVPEGAKLIMDDAHVATGGGATNAAAALQQLGIDTDVCCMIGTDCIAEWVHTDLCNRDIGCDYVRTTDAEHTALSSIIPAPGGNRTIFVYRGANAYLTPDHLPDSDQLAQYDGVYMTSLAKQSAEYASQIAETVQRHVPLLAHNPGSEELTEHTPQLCSALTHIDIFIVNAREARDLLAHMSQDPDCVRRILEDTNPRSDNSTPALLTDFETINNTCIDIRTYMREIMRRGPTTVVVTNGSEGVYVAHEDTLYFGPAPDVDVQCSVGAGDAFGSTLYASLLMGTSIETAMARGMHNSCSVLQSTDAKTQLRSQSELSDITSDHIQRYPLTHT